MFQSYMKQNFQFLYTASLKLFFFMESLVRDNGISYFINERGLSDLQGLQILLLNLLSSLSFASCEMEWALHEDYIQKTVLS